MHTDVQSIVAVHAAAVGAGVLMIAPNPRVGLTQPELGMIEAFAARLSAPDLTA